MLITALSWLTCLKPVHAVGHTGVFCSLTHSCSRSMGDRARIALNFQEMNLSVRSSPEDDHGIPIAIAKGVFSKEGATHLSSNRVRERCRSFPVQVCRSPRRRGVERRHPGCQPTFGVDRFGLDLRLGTPIPCVTSAKNPKIDSSEQLLRLQLCLVIAPHVATYAYYWWIRVLRQLTGIAGATLLILRRNMACTSTRMRLRMALRCSQKDLRKKMAGIERPDTVTNDGRKHNVRTHEVMPFRSPDSKLHHPQRIHGCWAFHAQGIHAR